MSFSKNGLEKITQKLKELITSHKVHTIIVVLVIIECLCVAGDLLLVELSKIIVKQEPICPLNATNNYSSNATNSLYGKDKTAYIVFYTLEMILKIISTTILAIFIIELLFKLILVPNIFSKSKWEIMDGIVVVVSFTLNIILISIKNKEQIISALFVIIR
jgi:hypothetical protein